MKKKKFSFKELWTVIKTSFTGFSDDKVTKLSGSLAYYTVFSMGPLLVMIISLCGIFLGREAVEGKIYGVLQGFVGSDTAAQLQQIIKNAAVGGKSTIAAVIGLSHCYWVLLRCSPKSRIPSIRSGVKAKAQTWLAEDGTKPFPVVFRHHQSRVYFAGFTGCQRTH